MSAITSRFLDWAAAHENAYVALYFAWVVFAWLLFLAGLAAAIYAAWKGMGMVFPTAPASPNTEYYQAVVRRGLDTYTMCHLTYTVKGRQIVRFFWVRLPRIKR